MQRTCWILALIAAPLFANIAKADDHGTRGPHGGEICAAGPHLCEVVFSANGVRAYLYDSEGRPLSAARIQGSMTLQAKGSQRNHRYDLYPEATKSADQNALFVLLDLSNIPDGSMQAAFAIGGFNGFRRAARFNCEFRLTRDATQLAIEKQQFCPVSSKPLGSMGRPVKVALGQSDVFVCCAGCTDALKSDPAKYLARLPRTDFTPVKATKADSAAIAHQKTCPVMDEPLGSMGPPLKITISGRDVFVCCKGCIKFLEKEPNKYIPLLPDPLPEKATATDAAAVKAQKVCPVMDEPLNSMGGPWKVVVNGQTVFVCCKGCIKKVQQQPDHYLGELQDRTAGSARLRR